MRNLKKLISLLLTLTLTAALAIPTSANFNAGLEVVKEVDTISVTVQDSPVLQSKQPTLSIPCDYTDAYVTFCGNIIDSTLSDGQIRFTVAAGGTYVITRGTSPTVPDNPVIPEAPVIPSIPDGSTTTTVRNPDGSVTTTKINNVTGIVTETTKCPDGNTTTVERHPDSTVVTTLSQANGTIIKAITDAASQTTAQISIPAAVGTAVVEIPSPVTTPGMAAVIIYPDKTEEIVKTSSVTETGIKLIASGNVLVKLVDNSVDFADVNANDWEKDAVDFVSARKLFGGVGAGLFASDSEMTRGMILTVLARLDGIDTTPSPGQHWYEPGVEWAVAQALSDGSNPDSSVTREQLAVFLWRYAGCPKVHDTALANLSSFPDDSSISSYAWHAMAWAVSNGIIEGLGDGTLNPQGNATRAQVAALLMRFISWNNR